jgi:hypothetical protein
LASSVPTTSGVWLRHYGLKLVFLFTYVILLVMIFEQGRIISEQQKLIRDLYPDSAKLATFKAQQSVQQNLRNRH